MLAGSF